MMPIVVPTASKTAVTVKPYFLKISLTFSLNLCVKDNLSISSSLSFSI